MWREHFLGLFAANRPLIRRAHPADRLITMSDIYLARQPIFDRSQSVIGYELLHRSGPENVFARIDSDIASSQTVDRAAMGVGLDELTDGRLAFVNVSRRVLVEEIYTLLPTQRTVIELLENIMPDPEVLKACYRLKAYGYKLALDDFAGDPHYIEMLALADIVKIDLLDEAAPRALKMVEPTNVHKPKENRTNPEFKKAWDEIAIGATLEQRKASFERAQRIAYDDVMVVPMGTMPKVQALRANVENFKSYYIPRMSNVWLK